ncbi:unnamed protein product [Prorocentrum cordatum]|uniref:Uncharacterized protein n=1 Tax=Prorocentrum cordatum TaxID=2364126 RepID=A0ABN9XA87_9DINO|nr:unnamed protein product [Polarella glacialis]
MANLVAGGVKSPGEMIAGDESATEQVAQAWGCMDTLNPYSRLEKPTRFESDPPGCYRLRDMPLRDIDNVVQVKHVVDWIKIGTECQELPDTSAVDMVDIMRRGDYASLPSPFKPKKDTGELACTMQIYVLPTDPDGVQSVLKYIKFDDSIRVDLVKDAFIVGAPLTIHWGRTSDAKKVRKLFHFMMDRLGGVQYRYFVQPSVKKAAEAGTYDRIARTAGYAFIRDHGPRSNAQNQFVEWTDDQIHLESSPIFGWTPGDVKDQAAKRTRGVERVPFALGADLIESLRNYANGTVGARTLMSWCHTLRQFHPTILNNIIAPALRTHDVHSIMWVGKTRVGKSSASKTTCFAISAYQIDKHGRSDLKPSVVTSKRIDFFRLEPGSLFKPAIADDTVMSKWGTDDVKAFHDPAEEDALLWARWGGAQFMMNQARQSCVNAYGKDFEARVQPVRPGAEAISFDDFVRIIQANFPRDARGSFEMADAEAYLARSRVVLLSDKRIYFRLASTDKESVPFFAWPNPAQPDLFVPESRDTVKKYKKDQTYKPPNFEIDFKWGQAFMRRLARGEAVQPAVTVRGPTLFDAQAPDRFFYPPMGEGAVAPTRAAPPPLMGESTDAPPRAALPRGGCPVDSQDKVDRDREMAKYLGGLARAHDRESIDLLSPPKKAAKSFNKLFASCPRDIDPGGASSEDSPSARRARAVFDAADADEEAAAALGIMSEQAEAEAGMPAPARPGAASDSGNLRPVKLEPGVFAKLAPSGGPPLIIDDSDEEAPHGTGDGLFGAGFKNCCMVDALNALGFNVPHAQDGPFSINDAEAMIAGDGCVIARASIRGACAVPTGRYIASYGSAPGVTGHAVAVLVFLGGFIVFDGDVRACHTGHVSWHIMPEGVRAEECNWWQVRGA